jgi:hypothetical protein
VALISHCANIDLLTERKKMTKYKYISVHTLHFQKTDQDGNSDGKIYEYLGDHSGFCDGIDNEYLKEIIEDKK